MRGLFTIGYEGAKLEDFVATLKMAKIDVLFDVRELPASRRKGFSKNALAEAVQKVGIEYQHDKRLGSPRDIRQQLYADGDYERFFSDFSDYLSTQMHVIQALSRQLKGNVALMCYERDPDTCHRRVVADALLKHTNKAPSHIGVQHDAARKKGNTSRSNLSEGLSAA